MSFTLTFGQDGSCATGGEIISAYITSAIVPGVNTYTVLSGRCVLQGWMIPL